MRSNYTVKNPHRDPNISNDRWDSNLQEQPEKSLSATEEQLLFEHLNRRCTCGSGDVWSECGGIEGDSSYCG